MLIKCFKVQIYQVFPYYVYLLCVPCMCKRTRMEALNKLFPLIMRLLRKVGKIQIYFQIGSTRWVNLSRGCESLTGWLGLMSKKRLLRHEPVSKSHFLLMQKCSGLGRPFLSGRPVRTVRWCERLSIRLLA